MHVLRPETSLYVPRSPDQNIATFVSVKIKHEGVNQKIRTLRTCMGYCSSVSSVLLHRRISTSKELIDIVDPVSLLESPADSSISARKFLTAVRGSKGRLCICSGALGYCCSRFTFMWSKPDGLMLKSGLIL